MFIYIYTPLSQNLHRLSLTSGKIALFTYLITHFSAFNNMLYFKREFNLPLHVFWEAGLSSKALTPSPWWACHVGLQTQQNGSKSSVDEAPLAEDVSFLPPQLQLLESPENLSYSWEIREGPSIDAWNPLVAGKKPEKNEQAAIQWGGGVHSILEISKNLHSPICNFLKKQICNKYE